ncbi:UNVERIFIED_CONTAM: hypothetical protein HDU68_002843 [Siphonaria sp. JEL0065]|nr:hypothetical protein HDU68_002843 [Siphonaria sp. JEL0065]
MSKLLHKSTHSLGKSLNLDTSQKSLSRSPSSSQKWLNSVVGVLSRSPSKSKFKEKDIDLGTPERRNNSSVQLPNVSLSRAASTKGSSSSKPLSRVNSTTYKPKEKDTTSATISQQQHQLHQREEDPQSDSEDIRFSELSDDDIPLSSKKKSILKKKEISRKPSQQLNDPSSLSKNSSIKNNENQGTLSDFSDEEALPNAKKGTSKKYVPLSDVSDMSDDEPPQQTLKKSPSKKSVKDSPHSQPTQTPTVDPKSPKSTPRSPNIAQESPLRRTSLDRSSSRSISPNRRAMTTMATSTSGLNRCFSSAEALSGAGLSHQSQRGYETFGTSISVKRTEHKVDEIKSIIEQQEAKLAKYGRLIEAADSRIRDHIEYNDESERSVLHKLTLEKEALIDDLKAERKSFNNVIIDAVRELKNAQQFQQKQQVEFLQAQKEIALLTEKHNVTIQSVTQQQQLPPQPCQECKIYAEEVHSLHLEIEKSNTDVNKLTRQVSDEKETNDSLAKHISEIQSLVQSQSDTIQCLTSVSTDLEMHLKEAMKKIESLTIERDKFQTQNKKLIQEADTLKDEVSHLEAALEKKKIWVFENKMHVDDYKSALAAVGMLDLMKGKGSQLKKTLSHNSLEDFITSTLKDLHDARKHLHRVQATENEQMQQIQNYKNELDKRNEMLEMSKAQLDSTFSMVEELRAERDYAISKIKDTVKMCKSRDTRFQAELEIREKGVLETIET